MEQAYIVRPRDNSKKEQRVASMLTRYHAELYDLNKRMQEHHDRNPHFPQMYNVLIQGGHWQSTPITQEYSKQYLFIRAERKRCCARIAKAHQDHEIELPPGWDQRGCKTWSTTLAYRPGNNVN